MTHINLNDGPLIAVDTEHGETFLAIGQHIVTGERRVIVILDQQDRHDMHLTFDQAREFFQAGLALIGDQT